MENVITSDVPLLPIDEDKSPEQAEQERQEENVDKNIAALANHPGWIELRAQMEREADILKNHDEIDFASLDDAELGRAIRTDKMLEQKLRNYIARVDIAAEVRAAERGEEPDEPTDD